MAVTTWQPRFEFCTIFANIFRRMPTKPVGKRDVRDFTDFEWPVYKFTTTKKKPTENGHFCVLVSITSIVNFGFSRVK